MSGYVLIDRPQRTPQCRFPRWEPMSGSVGVHTTEGALDAIAPDTGAENVAGFIVGRSDYGSYHEIVDSDSVVLMAPDHYMTWHTAAANLNGAAWGISAACRSTEWNPTDAWTQTTIATMGARIRAFWERNGHDPNVCARWLTKEQAWARWPGLYHHGTAQPIDRSDAWALHPQRPQLDQMLLDAILGATPPPNPTPPEDPMPYTLQEIGQAVVYEAHEIARAAESGGVYVLDLIGRTRVHLPDWPAVILTHVEGGVRFHGGTVDTCTVSGAYIDTFVLDGDDGPPVDLAPVLDAIAQNPGATVDELLARLGD